MTSNHSSAAAASSTVNNVLSIHDELGHPCSPVIRNTVIS